MPAGPALAARISADADQSGLRARCLAKQQLVCSSLSPSCKTSRKWRQAVQGPQVACRALTNWFRDLF